MEFKLFKNKSNDPTKSKLLLAQPTMLFGSLVPSDYQLVATHIVKSDEIVRPDLIALEHYGTANALDIILKFNNISDPFSIMPGETLYIPMETIPYYKLETPLMFEDNPIKNQFIQTKRLSKTDQRRLEALKQKYNKENLLPPNVIPVGKKNYEFDGTNVRLGMHAQTDPVVSSILSEMAGPNKNIKISEDALSINMDDNSQIVNNPNKGDDKQLESNFNNNSGLTGGTSGTSGTSGTKTDTADIAGGTKPDGSGPATNTNSVPENPDSPCSKK